MGNLYDAIFTWYYFGTRHTEADSIAFFTLSFVYVCVYMCMCVYVCVYIYIRTYIHIYVYLSVENGSKRHLFYYHFSQSHHQENVNVFSYIKLYHHGSIPFWKLESPIYLL